jgi:hypothetical protein
MPPAGRGEQPPLRNRRKGLLTPGNPVRRVLRGPDPRHVDPALGVGEPPWALVPLDRQVGSSLPSEARPIRGGGD